MSAMEQREKCPQDVIAIFHASFHPTQGNVLDWSLKANDDLNLDNLEFSALPSGLHLVEQDTVYFTKDGQHGVCVFRRRKTVEHGHRGFRLSSLGILLAKSRRPRPWKHVAGLKDLIMRIYSQSDDSETMELAQSHWEPARAFFDERKIRRADLGGAGDWDGWSHEFEQIDTGPSNSNPSLHLSHFLRIFGPSSLTLYKHVLGRRRILIYTLPPVEAACILCQVAADICYEAQHENSANNTSPHPHTRRLRGKSSEPINVLGMVNLNDLGRLHSEGQNGRGWIACTTDAIFLEKPSYYDLLIDLTTLTPNKATRPTFYSSKPILTQPGNTRGPTHRLSTIRFAWSDVKLWNELDRILQLDARDSAHQDCCVPSSPIDDSSKSKLVLAAPWTDAWRVYEDVCVICAGLWMGSWRGNSTMSYSTVEGAENWGKARSEGDDDFSLGGSSYIRSLGMGIEGGPTLGGSGTSAVAGTSTTPSRPTNRALARSSNMSWSSGRATVVPASPSSLTGDGSPNGKARQVSTSTITEDESADSNYDEERRERQLLTTLSLLQTFHAHTSFQLSVLETYLPFDDEPQTVSLSPKDILAFELGPLSGADAKYLEWLVQEYAATTTFVIRRSWRDLIGIIFGYG